MPPCSRPLMPWQVDQTVQRCTPGLAMWQTRARPRRCWRCLVFAHLEGMWRLVGGPQIKSSGDESCRWFLSFTVWLVDHWPAFRFKWRYKTHPGLFLQGFVGFEPIWYRSRTIGRKAKALDVPLQNVVHAAGIIDFCEVGKLTVEGWGRNKAWCGFDFLGWVGILSISNHAMLVQDFPGKQ